MKIDWEKVQLGQVCSFKYGQMPQKADLREAGYPVFSGYGVVGFSSKFHYEEPQIIVVARGVGGTGDVKMSPPFCFLTNLSIAVLPEQDRIYKPFLYYRLAGPGLWELRTGSAQAQITIERLRTYEIELPPLAVQRRIAAILAAYDDLIEVNRQRIALLEEMARRLFDEWFVHFRFPGHESRPMVDTPDGPLPEGWQRSRLNTVASINADTLRPSDAPDQIGYVDIASVVRGEIQKVEWQPFIDAPGRARRKVRDGSTIWSMVRPNRRSHALVLDPEDNLIVSTGFAVLDPREVSVSYLYHFVTTDTFVGYLVNNTTGAAYPAVTGAAFERALILLPPKALDGKFNAAVEPMMRLVNTMRRQNFRLAASRDLLLPRLISGELSVSVAERELDAAA